MTDPNAPTLTSSPPVEPQFERGEAPGVSTHPRPSHDGGARSFREQQVRRRITRRERLGIVLVVVIIALGAYTIVTARPFTGSTGGLQPVPGPEIVVQFGTPTISTLNCTAGGTAYIERIPWVNSTQPVSTSNIFVRVFEIFDGDYVGDPGAVANVTATNLCQGTPPDSSSRWYAVLAAPSGANLLTYTTGDSWRSVDGQALNFQIQSGSSMVLVSFASFSNTGHGFGVGGVAQGSVIRGTVPL